MLSMEVTEEPSPDKRMSQKQIDTRYTVYSNYMTVYEISIIVHFRIEHPSEYFDDERMRLMDTS